MTDADHKKNDVLPVEVSSIDSSGRAIDVTTVGMDVSHVQYVFKRFIVAAMLGRPLGDFIVNNVYAAAVKLNSLDTKLIAYYRDDRPYKKSILSMNPYIDFVIDSGEGAGIPLDFFNSAGDATVFPQLNRLKAAGISGPKHLLVPSSMRMMDLARFERLPVFRVPAKVRTAQEARLVELGLDPGKWFCALTYRLPNYGFRGASSYRDVDDRDYEGLMNRIIDDLGGQVVRIGHPEMRPFRARKGYIDLAGERDAFALHATAVLRSRFLITSATGTSQIAAMFNVPFAQTNAVSAVGVWRDNQVILPRNFYTADGRRIPATELARRRLFEENSIKDGERNSTIKWVSNSVDELCAVARYLHDMTPECTGWRTPSEIPLPSANVSPFDPSAPFRIKAKVLQFPDLQPAETV